MTSRMYSSSNDFKSYGTSNNGRTGTAADTTSSVTKLTSYSRSRSVDDINRSNQIGSTDRRFKTMARDYKSYRDTSDTGGATVTGVVGDSLQSCHHNHGLGGTTTGSSSYLRGRDRSTKDTANSNSKVLITEEGGVDRRTSKNQYRITGRITRSPSPAEGTRFSKTTSISHHNHGIVGSGDGTKSSSKLISSTANTGVVSGGGAPSSYMRDINNSVDLTATAVRSDVNCTHGGVSSLNDKGKLTRDGISILGGSSKGYQADDGFRDNRAGGRSGASYGGKDIGGSSYLTGTTGGYGRTTGGHTGGVVGSRSGLQLPYPRQAARSGGGGGGGGVGLPYHQGRGSDGNRFLTTTNPTGAGSRRTGGGGGGGVGVHPRNDNSYDRHISPERSYTDDNLQQSRPSHNHHHHHHRPLNRQRSRTGRTPSDRRRIGSSRRGPSVRRSRSMNDLLGGGRRSPSPNKRTTGGGGGAGGAGNMDVLNDSFPVCKRFPNCSVCVIDIPLKQENNGVRFISTCCLSYYF